jgi:GDP-mannose pyrophosphatase NudK
MKTTIKNIQTKILANDWSILKKLTYEFLKKDGTWETQVREAYDRGNGATILLYNPKKQTVILTQQFRIPTYLNGNDNGLMIEACAGKVDQGEDPEECVRREAEEETGYRLKTVQKAFEAYMSPGSVTEKIFFFMAPYDQSMKISDGGGLSTEQENIEVIEVLFADALSMIQNNEIQDAKTIMLLQYAKINGLLTF